MAGATRAERLDGEDGDALALEQALRELRRGDAAGAHVEHDEHPALRHVAAQARLSVDARHDGRAALVGGAHLGRRRIGLAQRGRGRVRDEGRRAEEHAVEQEHEARDERLGHDGPARAPARHGVRLREARDARHALLGALDREHARVRAASEEERAVDLVGDEPEIVRARELAERRERVCGQAGAGGVVRRRQHDGAGASRDRRLHVGCLELESALRAERDVDRRCACSREDPGVGGVERLRDDDLVAFAEHGDADGEHRGLRAGEEDDATRVHRSPGPGRRAPGDLLAQGGVALRVGVVRAPGAHRGVGGLDDGGRRLEVGIADRQHDHVLAARAPLRGQAMDVPGLVVVSGEAVGEGREAHAPDGSGTPQRSRPVTIGW